MNERLKELESQCWESRQYGPPWFDYKKFAELIVKECACIADDMKSLETARAIKEQFGVKE